jgi:multimeric flavodoxin WrbA
MNILAIVGSPRRNGNTAKLVRRIEERMKAQGDVTFDYLYLGDANLEPCRGCFACVTKGEDLCPIHDDRPAIEERMQAADGVVFATPSYVMMVSALMKQFIERFAYVCHRPRFFGKAALVVGTTCGSGVKEATDYVASIAGSWGFSVVDKLGVMTHPAFAPSDEKLAKQVDRAAMRFYRAIATGKLPAPSLADMLQFRFMRGNAELVPDMFPADLAYYQEQGWFDQAYFTRQTLNPLKNALAGVVFFTVGRIMGGGRQPSVAGQNEQD